MTEAASFFVDEGAGTFSSTSATTSPWDARQQHGGPPSALLARALERCAPREDMRFGHVAVDLLGPVPQGRLQVAARVLRPGRRVELVEATLAHDGVVAAVARGWRTASARVPSGLGAADPEPRTPPDPQAQRYFPGVPDDWGYGRAFDWRFERGGFGDLGPGVVWARMGVEVVAGEQPSGLQRVMAVADSANGLSAELDLHAWYFVPPTVVVTLHREPATAWLRLDARTTIGPDGLAMTHAGLADESGPVGVVTQSLFVGPR